MNKLPHNPQAERALLSSIVFNDDGIHEAIRALGQAQEKVFYSDANRKVFAAMRAISNGGQAIDISSLLSKLPEDIHSNVMDLSDVSSMASDTTGYAGEVFEQYRCREIALLGDSIAAAARAGRSSEELTARIQRAVESSEAFTAAEPVSIASALPDVLERFHERVFPTSQKKPAMKSGLAVIDRVMNGFPDDELTLIAARPGVGKTALALFSAWNAVNNGNVALFFSLEMSIDRVAGRLMQLEGIDTHRIHTGFLGEREYDKAVQVAQALEGIPIYVDEERQTCSKILSTARRFHKKHGRSLIIVDYLQYMVMEGAQDKRYLAIGENVKRLKTLAKELHCPVLLLAQLSREAESMSSGYEMLRCMYESGNIEQDIDNAIILHVPKLEGVQNLEHEILTQVTIAKGRNVGTGHSQMIFNRKSQKFEVIPE